MSAQISLTRSTGQLSLAAPRSVYRVLEAVDRDLPERGRKRVLDPAGQKREARLRVVLALEQELEGQRLAEHRRGLGERQRRARVEEAERLRQHAVQAVAELVRKRQDTAPLARVVHEHVRVDVRDGGRAERARRLARPQRGVDPVALEEAGDDLARARVKVAESLEHGVARLVPGDGRRLALERGVAVVVVERVQPEQLRLEAVVALRDVVPRSQRLDQAVDGLVGDLVREVARRDPAWVRAQAILDRPLVEDGVEDVGARAQARCERVGHGLGDRPALALVAQLLQPGERLVERGLRPVDLDAEVGDQLLEEAHPRAVAGDALLGVQPLLRLGEHVRAVAALGAQDVRVVRERRVGEQLLRAVVVDLDPLELEEQQLGLDRSPLLACALGERAARFVRGVRGVTELRVGLRARDDGVDALGLGRRLAQAGRLEPRDLAAVALAEGLRVGEGAVEVAGEARVVGARVEIVEVPLDGFGAGHRCGHGGTLASDGSAERCEATRRVG